MGLSLAALEQRPHPQHSCLGLRLVHRLEGHQLGAEPLGWMGLKWGSWRGVADWGQQLLVWAWRGVMMEGVLMAEGRRWWGQMLEQWPGQG